jgi:ABC-2 type transport system permease protein
MNSLFKKELNTFFGSFTGYLVISIFLLTTSLFLWVIPGNFNIIDGQRATLKGFFELAPWLYLFLIPAITMRMFAEEKRMGTLEMLITRPITTSSIVIAKYLAALCLVTITLLPTLLYFYSVYQLGNPAGNIDTGATWGSFLGLLFLASVYISIGLLASILTSNQVVSFLISITLSYIVFLGFDFIATSGSTIGFQNFFFKLGIHQHYQSISRGVIDSRDLFYFIAATLFFLYATRLCLLNPKIKQLLNLKNTTFLIGLIILSAWLVNQRFFRIDLTTEHRYSLNDASIQLLKQQEHSIYFKNYLSGNLPSEMKEFQEAIIEKIEDFNAYSAKPILHTTIDIYQISPTDEQNKAIQSLINAGIQAVNFGHKTTEGLSTKQIFPGVVIQSDNKMIALNLLKNNPLLSSDENLKQSIELLEYEFTKAIQNLHREQKPRIAFLKGQGEANTYETGDIRYSLSENYEVIDRTATELLNDDTTKTLIIAAPTEKFNEQDKLYIDQFIMKGGKVLWCIDPVQVSIDSLSRGLSTLAFDRGLNLRDQLFNYGIRLNSDLLQDAFCLEYPINTAPPGQATKFTPAPFYFAPLALPNPSHPLSRNLNNVMIEFTSSLDLVGENSEVKGTPILGTSPYGRSIQTPVEVSLLSATNPPDKRLFNRPNIPIGIVLEGKFKSAFKNRMTTQYGLPSITDKSLPTKMIVIANGNIIKNKVRNRNGKIQLQALGYDQYSGQTFGNRELITNCVDYLSDNSKLMQLRSRGIQLRMLDKVKIRDEKTKWQILNTVFPLVFFLFFGIIFTIIRKKRNS